MKRIQRSALLCIFSLWSLSIVSSQTITWTGSGDGVNWSDKSNWDLGVLPSSNSYVVINGVPGGVKVDTVVPLVMSIDCISSLLIVSDSLTVSNTDTVCIRLTNSDLDIGATTMIMNGDEFAMHLDASSQLTVGGELIVRQPGSVGVHNEGTIFIQQSGKITYEDASILALRNNATYTLAGEMNVLRTTGILNNGTFTIQPLGQLIFDNKNSLHTFPAFFNQGDLMNQGLLSINDFAGEGILQQGLTSSITNDGLIIIDSTDEQAIYLNGGVITNNEKITISNSKEEGLYFIGGTFENNDTLMIHEVDRSGILMDFNFSTTSQLNNLSAGYIGITKAASLLTNTAGIRLGDPGSITNLGKIYLEDCGNYGLLVQDDAVFDHQSGLIQMVNLDDEGLALKDNGTLMISSSADLQISLVTGDPLIIDAGGILDCLGMMDIGQ